jgi:hypothetical protein
MGYELHEGNHPFAHKSAIFQMAAGDGTEYSLLLILHYPMGMG